MTLDLLDDDCYGAIADIIASRFPEWELGFAAGAVFLGSAAGIRHSSQNASLANSLHPEGILQLGERNSNVVRAEKYFSLPRDEALKT